MNPTQNLDAAMNQLIADLGRVEIGQKAKSALNFKAAGMIEMSVDITAAPFDINIRYAVQTVTINPKKRGNLAKFAGQKVDVVCTTISRYSPRIIFWIKASTTI